MRDKRDKKDVWNDAHDSARERGEAECRCVRIADEAVADWLNAKLERIQND